MRYLFVDRHRLGFFSTEMTRSRCAVSSISGCFERLTSFLPGPNTSNILILLKLRSLDAFPSPRNDGASNPLAWNTHACSVGHGTCRSLARFTGQSIRVYAFYNRNKIILYCLSASLLLQTAAGIWQYTIEGARRESPRARDKLGADNCIYLSCATPSR
jgi:hypothetical protein